MKSINEIIWGLIEEGYAIDEIIDTAQMIQGEMAKKEDQEAGDGDNFTEN